MRENQPPGLGTSPKAKGFSSRPVVDARSIQLTAGSILNIPISSPELKSEHQTAASMATNGTRETPRSSLDLQRNAEQDRLDKLLVLNRLVR